MNHSFKTSILWTLSAGLTAMTFLGATTPRPAQAAAVRVAQASAVEKAIFVRLKAKAGKEAELAAFLRSAKPLVMDEPQTALWFAVQFDASTFAIFDAMPTEAGRDAHLAGKVAAALMANASALLSEPPVIEKADILVKKVNKG